MTFNKSSSNNNILIGSLARDPSVLRHVGHVLLQLSHWN